MMRFIHQMKQQLPISYLHTTVIKAPSLAQFLRYSRVTRRQTDGQTARVDNIALPILAGKLIMVSDNEFHRNKNTQRRTSWCYCHRTWVALELNGGRRTTEPRHVTWYDGHVASHCSDDVIVDLWRHVFPRLQHCGEPIIHSTKNIAAVEPRVANKLLLTSGTVKNYK